MIGEERLRVDSESGYRATLQSDRIWEEVTNALVVGDGGDRENSLAMHEEQWHVTYCLDLSDLIGPLNKREAAIGQTFT
jgi:hypothetical protein